ncbi:MAG: acylphosphatase [Campylobacterota bacterium]
MSNYRFFISGRVQGVYYRANVAKNAQNAGFSGYVRNLDDGRVEATVSCEEVRLEIFIKILKEGSPKSDVTSIDEQVIAELFSGDFEIYY